MRIEKNYDAVVIGGGISGLTSALLLAARGKKTAVLEQGATLSPVMQGFDRKGVHFETGFHYASALGKGEVGEFIFKSLGLNIKPVPALENGYDEIHILPTGRIFKMAYGRDKLKENLVAAFPEEEAAISKYLDMVEDKVSKSAFLNLHKDNNLDFNTVINAGETLQEVLDKTFKSPEIKAIFAAATFLHGTPPGKIAFAQHCCIAGGLYNSAWEIEGGGRSITNAYGAALKKAGVDVYLNTKAVKIEEAQDLKIITDAKGNIFKAGLCVSTVHPSVFFDIAPQSVYRAGYKERVRELEETPGFFALYGVLNKETFFNKSNVFLITDLDVNKIYQKDYAKGAYYINFSRTSPQAVSIISLTSSSAQSWDRSAADYKDKKAATAKKVKEDIAALVPELKDNIEYLDAATPATMQRYAGYYGGYGLMHDVSKTKVLPFTKIKGLYVSGQSVVAPGLLGTIITSLLVDKLI